MSIDYKYLGVLNSLSKDGQCFKLHPDKGISDFIWSQESIQHYRGTEWYNYERL